MKSTVAALVVAAVAGATVRWWAGAMWEPRSALLVANIVGCGFVGWANRAGWAYKRGRLSQKQPGVWFTIGWCGGLTSFSAVAVELAIDLDAGEIARAASWLGLTLICCTLAFVLPSAFSSVREKRSHS